jgi:hypothetical protein
MAKHSPQYEESNLIVQISTAFSRNCGRIATPGTNSGKVEPFRGAVSVSFSHGSFLNQVVALREIARSILQQATIVPSPAAVEAEDTGDDDLRQSQSAMTRVDAARRIESGFRFELRLRMLRLSIVSPASSASWFVIALFRDG